MNTDDPILVGMYFSRDENALQRTKEYYGSYCRSIAWGILGEISEVEECENDVYHVLWNCIPPTVPQCFRTFLGNIARRLSIDRLRKRTAQKRSALSAVMMELDDLIGENPSPEVMIEGEELRQLLRRFLAELSPRAQDIFVQSYWYLKDVAAIAQMHGCSESTVRSTLSRTRSALKKMLTEEGYL